MQAPTDDYIPLASARALAALEKLFGGNPALQVLVTEVRRGFQIVDSKKKLLLKRIAELELKSSIHDKSSAKLSARALLEKTEREITLSAGFAGSGISPINQSLVEQRFGDPVRYPRSQVLKWEFQNVGRLRTHVEIATKIGRSQRRNLQRNIGVYLDCYHDLSGQIHRHLRDCQHSPEIILDDSALALCRPKSPGTALELLKGLADYLGMPYNVI